MKQQIGQSIWIQFTCVCVFCHSTEGDDWARCNAPSNITDSEAIDEAIENCSMAVRGNAWLTPVSECTKAGVICEFTQMWGTDVGKSSFI